MAISLGPIYTKRQRQRCDNSAMTLAILFSLKTVESLENVKTTPLFSIRRSFVKDLEALVAGE